MFIYERSSKMASHIVGYPRMGPKREPKLALESFWDRKSIPGYLQKVAADLRESIWNPSVEYFIVPEWGPAVKFSYASHKGVTEYKEAKAGVTAFGFDLVRGTKTLDLIKDDFPEGEYLFAGMVDGWNIWANDLAASLSTLESLEGIVGKDKLVVSIAVQKVVDEVIFYANAAAQASRKSSPRGQRCGGPKLFRIEETKGDRDPISNTEEEIGISPPANNRSPRPMMVKISRSPRPKTMRVKITVNSREYIALIDTGSTYNVLHPRVAGEMGLKIIHDDPIEVRIADGSIMRSEGSCPEFKFEIQEGQFATEAYILQLGGFDVILGIEWLVGLGQIKNWDFASLKMEFTQGDTTIQIKGMDTEESEVGCSTGEKLVSMVRAGVKYYINSKYIN